MASFVSQDMNCLVSWILKIPIYSNPAPILDNPAALDCGNKVPENISCKLKCSERKIIDYNCFRLTRGKSELCNLFIRIRKGLNLNKIKWMDCLLG